MKAIVIDTNVFVTALRAEDSAATSSRALLRAVLLRRYKPLFGNALWLEYEDLLHGQLIWPHIKILTPAECLEVLP